MRVTFHGVRGSLPASTPQTSRYGGHTLCIEIASGDASMVLIDGGTGITRVDPGGLDAVSEFHVLLTHYHWDHIQGLPFFPPLYDEANTFTLYGHSWDGLGPREILDQALRPPFFPVSIETTAALKRYVTVASTVLQIGGLTITTAPLHHPQGVTAYRVDGPSRSIVIATDCEHGDARADDALRTLATGADVLVHDGQYGPEEYEQHRIGWGHSTWEQATRVAREAGVGELILISHDPARTDDGIDSFVARAREAFTNTRAAFEGMQLEL
ncbi:MAG: MBL fold metallo-hydrolase [Acidimicrobiia bacterium]